MIKKDYFDLTGKVALVTGASSGLGSHFAKTLSNHGARIILAARRKDKLLKLSKALNTDSFIVPLDVTLQKSVDNLEKEIIRLVGKLDICVNNAGISDPVRFKDLTEESWLKVLETNLNGAFRVAKMATNIMLQNKTSGSIINIASILGERVGLNLTSYASGKAALVQLTTVSYTHLTMPTILLV